MSLQVRGRCLLMALEQPYDLFPFAVLVRNFLEVDLRCLLLTWFCSHVTVSQSLCNKEAHHPDLSDRSFKVEDLGSTVRFAGQ